MSMCSTTSKQRNLGWTSSSVPCVIVFYTTILVLLLITVRGSPTCSLTGLHSHLYTSSHTYHLRSNLSLMPHVRVGSRVVVPCSLRYSLLVHVFLFLAGVSNLQPRSPQSPDRRRRLIGRVVQEIAHLGLFTGYLSRSSAYFPRIL